MVASKSTWRDGGVRFGHHLDEATMKHGCGRSLKSRISNFFIYFVFLFMIWSLSTLVLMQSLNTRVT
jgi:hypothetical protein